MSGHLSKSAFFEEGESLSVNILQGRRHRPPVLVSENQSDCRFVWYQNIRSASFSFVTIHASDGRTELRQQYRALQYMQSHGKNDTQFMNYLFGLDLVLNLTFDLTW